MHIEIKWFVEKASSSSLNVFPGLLDEQGHDLIHGRIGIDLARDDPVKIFSPQARPAI
jgi:hypothetical protein